MAAEMVIIMMVMLPYGQRIWQFEAIMEKLGYSSLRREKRGPLSSEPPTKNGPSIRRKGQVKHAQLQQFYNEAFLKS